MNKLFTKAATIVYVICQALAFIIVEMISAVYMKIYKMKIEKPNRNYEEENDYYLEA